MVRPRPPFWWQADRLRCFADQCDRRPMTEELWQLRVVAVPQREHVAGTLDDERLPPTVFEIFLSYDEVAWRDLVPAFRKARRYLRQVLAADGCSWLQRKR